ncbi:transcriptional regulator LysR family [Cupriavidus necator N-1]|uniref:Transcriptional regulator LysR family n=1 Tax=Cupriavidus necator (strain ATCC 43291 / DSM 13513 / CCUG 52238 / LMG 8453 / N-1) TaxID=1042878 RepID=F8GMH4_CUPNN|nr:transcriptional regulator LysR family [Cupriavidus necator N-1]
MHWLGWIRFFEAAARHESFVRAAEELHLTHGAVSRQIRQLEDTLGVALFERRNRGVFLTEAGRTLFAASTQSMEVLAGAAARIRTQPPGRALVLSCEPTIAMRWLIPRLPRFAARHPDIPLHLMAAGGPIDFTRSGADLALRRNDFAFDARWHAREVAQERVGPVCRPSLRRGRHGPGAPAYAHAARGMAALAGGARRCRRRRAVRRRRLVRAFLPQPAGRRRGAGLGHGLAADGRRRDRRWPAGRAIRLCGRRIGLSSAVARTV